MLAAPIEGFEPPPLYRHIVQGGFLPALAFTDFEWIPPQEMRRGSVFEDSISEVVPFAYSGRRDEWAWRLDWRQGDDVPVVRLWRENPGEGYAPHLEGFLYRRMLDEFASTWRVRDEEDLDGAAQVRRMAEVVASLIRRE